MRELKMPEALPGYSGGELPGRCKAEEVNKRKKWKRKCEGGQRGEECNFDHRAT